MPTSTHEVASEGDTLEHRIAARVRAALAYSGLRNPEVLERMGGLMSDATLRRITSAANPRGASEYELAKLAEACGVPRSWLELGEWSDAETLPPALLNVDHAAFDASAPTEQRLETLERYVETLLRIEQRRYGDALPLPRPTPLTRPRAQSTKRASAALPRATGAGER
jgi:hypothetical protein